MISTATEATRPASKAISPLVNHKGEGRTSAPKTILYDRFGVPLPNVDQRKTDIHGRELQPDSDPHMDYLPTELSAEGKRQRQELLLGKLFKRKFTQPQIDQVRHRVRMNYARTIVTQNLKNVTMKHLWWPEAGDIGTYEMRDGNPPADADRPKHLRGFDLHINCTSIPDDVRATLCHGGKLEQIVDARIEASGITNVPSAVVLQAVINELAEMMAERGYRL